MFIDLYNKNKEDEMKKGMLVFVGVLVVVLMIITGNVIFTNPKSEQKTEHCNDKFNNEILYRIKNDTKKRWMGFFLVQSNQKQIAFLSNMLIGDFIYPRKKLVVSSIAIPTKANGSVFHVPHNIFGDDTEIVIYTNRLLAFNYQYCNCDIYTNKYIARVFENKIVCLDETKLFCGKLYYLSLTSTLFENRNECSY